MGQRSRTASACEIRQRESRPQWETASSGCATFVSVVQTANFWQFQHSAECGRLNSARNRCVLVEGQMSARASVIRKIGIQHSSETRLVDDDNLIQAFSPYRPDQPLRVGILPGRAWSTKHLFDAQPCGRLTEYLPIVAVAITQEIPRSRVPREGLQQLLGRPLRRRMAGDREVHEPTAVMAKDYEHKQPAKCGGWNDEDRARKTWKRGN